MLKAVLFDVDGVLADTEPLHFLAAKLVLKEGGIDLPDSMFPEYVGITEEAIWRKACKVYGIKHSFQDFEKKRRKYFFEIIEKDLAPLKGVLRFIKELQSKGIQMAVVTSSGREIAEKILTKIELKPYFNRIISADDVTNKKPHAEPYNLALSKLKLKPQDCVAIEDSSHGIDAAKDAGLVCIGIKTYDDEKALKKADCIISTFEELNLRRVSALLTSI